MDKEERSVYRIAKTANVTPQLIREIHRTYHEIGQCLYPRRPGKKPRPFPNEERNLILEIRKKHPILGAIALEKMLDEQSVHIPHNRIHRILKKE